jgi:dephospho-CoA kinase
MLKIGLTGGIGSGKSTIAKVFEVLGVPVYYADDAAKRLMNENEELKQQLIHHFGADTYINGMLNRSHLSAMVFNSREKLDLLNSLVHPVTITDAAAWFARQQSAYVIKEAALLFESGTTAGLDYVIGVYAPVPVRIKRVMDREGVTAGDVKRRMVSQVDDTIKMRLCDFIIKNDGQQMVIPQVEQLHHHFTQISKQEITV